MIEILNMKNSFTASKIFESSEDNHENELELREKETIDLILHFFSDIWPILVFFSDRDKKEILAYKAADKIEKIKIQNETRIKNLNKLKAEVESYEVLEICKENNIVRNSKENLLRLKRITVREVSKLAVIIRVRV